MDVINFRSLNLPCLLHLLKFFCCWYWYPTFYSILSLHCTLHISHSWYDDVVPFHLNLRLTWKWGNGRGRLFLSIFMLYHVGQCKLLNRSWHVCLFVATSHDQMHVFFSFSFLVAVMSETLGEKSNFIFRWLLSI